MIRWLINQFRQRPEFTVPTEEELRDRAVALRVDKGRALLIDVDERIRAIQAGKLDELMTVEDRVLKWYFSKENTRV